MAAARAAVSALMYEEVMGWFEDLNGTCFEWKGMVF